MTQILFSETVLIWTRFQDEFQSFGFAASGNRERIGSEGRQKRLSLYLMKCQLPLSTKSSAQ